MRVEALIVSGFLASGTKTVDCFMRPTCRNIGRRSAASHTTRDGTRTTMMASATRTCKNTMMNSMRAISGKTPPSSSTTPFLPRRASRKRPRPPQLVQSAAEDMSAGPDFLPNSHSELHSSEDRCLLPPRLQALVDTLDLAQDLCSKSKALVEMGDAFSLTESFVDVALAREQPAAGEGAGAFNTGAPSVERAGLMQKVPGCVSEVFVTVGLHHHSPDGTSLSAAEVDFENNGTVSIRGGADARVSRGILALLAQGLEGESPATVLGLKGEAVAAAIGMRAGLTTSRINGLGNVLAVIQGQVRERRRFMELLEPQRQVASTDSAERNVEVVGLALPSRGGADARDNRSSERNLPSENSRSWTPMPGVEEEVAVLLSGGVDSSVALRLLQDQGYRIRAFYLKIWLEDELAHLGECPWEEDLAFATAVCEQAGVPLEVVPLQREYWEHVVAYTVQEAREGRTPNPDVMCNSRIKFGMFYDLVGNHFKHVATGHYARLERDNTDERSEGRVRLLLSPDAVKDQTYFLCALTQSQLQKALFPVGAFTKEKIRELAISYDVPTKSRKDSQGICFLGKLKFDDFLRHYLGESPGPVVDRQTGEEIGLHRGLWFHTIGQRRGIGPVLNVGIVHKGPWFVSGKDVSNNVLQVTNDFEAFDGPRESFQVEALRWIAGRPPLDLEEAGAIRLQVKTRHGPQLKECLLRLLDDETRPLYTPKDNPARCANEGWRSEFGPVVPSNPGGVHVDGGRKISAAREPASSPLKTTPPLHRGHVLLGTKDSGLAPGQFAAFYLRDECLGAGVISDSHALNGNEGDAAAIEAVATSTFEFSQTDGSEGRLSVEESSGSRR